MTHTPWLSSEIRGGRAPDRWRVPLPSLAPWHGLQGMLGRGAGQCNNQQQQAGRGRFPVRGFQWGAQCNPCWRDRPRLPPTSVLTPHGSSYQMDRSNFQLPGWPGNQYSVHGSPLSSGLVQPAPPFPCILSFLLSVFSLQSKGSYRDGGCSGLQDSGDNQHKPVDSRNRTTSLQALRLHARKLNIVALVFVCPRRKAGTCGEGRKAARCQTYFHRVGVFPAFFLLGFPS